MSSGCILHDAIGAPARCAVGSCSRPGGMPGTRRVGEPARRDACRGDRPPVAGRRHADAARHDLPHRLDDQADHRGRRDDPGRGVQAAARRSGRRLLPELADRRVLKSLEGPLDDTVPAKRPITLRDLLTFRFGLGAVMVWPPRHPIQKAMDEAGLAPGPIVPTVRPTST